ncbi:WecB/TagA/CpsF family glycosyltransferase [bacterium]|jgi:N-acetylglucosaminyldiphosphoundecaprenol N-acetyl-beta-D-mannosaminyltransferase|nr:WecB/TagA/CpsF family glycosyltransferase [bacterium]
MSLKSQFVRLFDYPIKVGTRKNIMESILGTSKTSFCHVVTLNPEIIVYNEIDINKKRKMLDKCFFIADGISLAWASKILQKKKIDRFPGIELAQALLTREDKTFYFIGSKTEIIEKAVKKIGGQNEKLSIVGYSDGYLDEQKRSNVLEDIKNKQPDIVLVGMGHQRQDDLLFEIGQILTKGVGVGIGGSFDVLSGELMRAPKWIQSIQLEWFYRGLSNPLRMKRWGFIPKFIKLVIKAF